MVDKIGLRNTRTGEKVLYLLQFDVLLRYMTGGREGLLNLSYVSIRDSLGRNLSEMLFRETRHQLVRSILGTLPEHEQNLVLRCIISIEILRRLEKGSVSDRQLVEWLKRVLPVSQECQHDVSFRCILGALARHPRDLRGLPYGLARLRAALEEGRIGFFDYAMVALAASMANAAIAEFMARDLMPYFDSDNMLLSELSYHIYLMLVFRHDMRLPDDLEEHLAMVQYSPDTVAACRAHQLLERVIDAEHIERWGLRPCMVLAYYRGLVDLYVVE